jgi:8-oxo-dGTP pyrophosphatase MutT (NUDIX family)
MQSEGREDRGPRVPRTSAEWRARIVERLANTQPNHAKEDWLAPGMSVLESRALHAYFPASPAPAAVLVPLVERADELTVLLTQRASQLKNHAGQISFPGGRAEPEDAGPSATALREAQEEIGLERQFVSVVGYLPDHILLSGFLVTPVVGFVQPGFELFLDAQEVADTFEVPLLHIFEPNNHRFSHRRLQGAADDVRVWDIQYNGHNIWGATAGMLLNLYKLCVAESPERAWHPSGALNE